MTRNAGGDDAVAIVEVVIGNILGPFITPGLILAFMPTDPVFDGWHPSDKGGLGGLYKETFKQLGLSVLVPFFAGQLVQWTFPRRTKWVVETFYLAKVGTACLLLLIW